MKLWTVLFVLMGMLLFSASALAVCDDCGGDGFCDDCHGTGIILSTGINHSILRINCVSSDFAGGRCVTCNPVSDDPDEPAVHAYIFADPVVEEVVRTTLNKPQGEVTIDDLLTVKEISIIDTPLVSMHDFGYMLSLEKLVLKGCGIQRISSISQSGKLTYLDLSSNQIESVNALAGLTELETLKLQNNRIDSVTHLCDLRKLKCLVLHNNEITSVTLLRWLKDLEELWLSENNINKIDDLAELTKMKKLYLHGNRIEDISALASMINLTTLNLKNNRISDTSPLAGLEKLEACSLAGNPLDRIMKAAPEMPE